LRSGRGKTQKGEKRERSTEMEAEIGVVSPYFSLIYSNALAYRGYA